MPDIQEKQHFYDASPNVEVCGLYDTKMFNGKNKHGVFNCRCLLFVFSLRQGLKKKKKISGIFY